MNPIARYLLTRHRLDGITYAIVLVVGFVACYCAGRVVGMVEFASEVLRDADPQTAPELARAIGSLEVLRVIAIWLRVMFWIAAVPLSVFVLLLELARLIFGPVPDQTGSSHSAPG